MFRDFFCYLYKEEITSLGNLKMRLDALADASRQTDKFVKKFSSKHQGLFQKVLHLFKKVLDVFDKTLDLIRNSPSPSSILDLSFFDKFFLFFFAFIKTLFTFAYRKTINNHC